MAVASTHCISVDFGETSLKIPDVVRAAPDKPEEHELPT